MSLDVYPEATRPTEAYWRNIAHNLCKMADEAGIYEAIWRPDEIGITHAAQLIPMLESGLVKLESQRERFEKLNPANGCRDYRALVNSVGEYLRMCRENPTASVEIIR